MRYLKKIFLTAIAAALVFTVLLCRADASTTSKAKKAYKKYVSEHSVEDPYMYGMKNPDYKIVDLNGDKTPELLFVNGEDHKAEIWTFRGGKMRCMHKEGYGKIASFAYKKSKHQVAVLNMHTKGYTMFIFKVKKTKLKRTKTILETIDTKYCINGKSVSKKKFKKTWNKYTFTDSYWKLK